MPRRRRHSSPLQTNYRVPGSHSVPQDVPLPDLEGRALRKCGDDDPHETAHLRASSATNANSRNRYGESNNLSALPVGNPRRIPLKHRSPRKISTPTPIAPAHRRSSNDPPARSIRATARATDNRGFSSILFGAICVFVRTLLRRKGCFVYFRRIL